MKEKDKHIVKLSGKIFKDIIEDVIKIEGFAFVGGI